MATLPEYLEPTPDVWTLAGQGPLMIDPVVGGSYDFVISASDSDVGEPQAYHKSVDEESYPGAEYVWVRTRNALKLVVTEVR